MNLLKTNKYRIITYKSDGHDKKAFSFAFKKPLNLSKRYDKKRLTFSYNGTDYRFNANYSKPQINFFKTLPRSDYNIYLHTKTPQIALYNLYKELYMALKGKSEIEAVNIILRMVQKSFRYKTDQQQFGYEKVFLPQETLFYPYSDCEDRSMIFAHLIRQVLGLKVVLLKYPDHIATAVRFSTHIQGDSLNYKGKRFVIADPTYINADVGQTMPKYKNAKVRIIE